MENKANQLVDSDVQWIARLKTFNLWPNVLRELIVDRAIADTSCTPEKEISAWQNFCQQQRIDPNSQNGTSDNPLRLNLEDLRAICRRQVRIEKFKVTTWQKSLPAYFLKRKTALDRVVYSVLRLRDEALTQELYLRIKEGEETFAHLAAQHSEGPESHTGGIIGPIALGTLAPELMSLLAASEPGRLRSPVRIGQWMVIARVEKRWPVEFDENVQRQLLQELFDIWLGLELKKHLIQPSP
jgi:hypothetical protein